MRTINFLFSTLFVLIGLTASVQAQPRLGTWNSLADFPAGNWTEVYWGGTDGAPGNEIKGESPGVYGFEGAILDHALVDENGSDYIKYTMEYLGGTVELMNGPSVPWYNSTDSAGSFIIVLGTSTKQSWKYDDETESFQLSLKGEIENYPDYAAEITARYTSGTPQVSGSGEPDDPYVYFDDLSWMQISVTGPIAVDIKPGACPNPLNTSSKGVLPVAILGAGTFDVNAVDPGSVEILGIKALRWSWQDVSTPAEPLIGKQSASDCNTLGPDGFMDLILKFKTQEIVNALGPVNDGDILTLELTGSLEDGTSIRGEDVMVILQKGQAAQRNKITAACKRTKLKAMAKLCRSYTYCRMNMPDVLSGDPDNNDCLGNAASNFEHSWGKAENLGASDCGAGSMASIQNKICDGLNNIHGQIADGLVSSGQDSNNFVRSMLKITANHCGVLLKNANGSVKGTKSMARNKSEEKYRNRLEKVMAFREKRQVEYNGPSIEEVMSMTDELVEDVLVDMGL